MYVTANTWLEQGPQRRGLGDVCPEGTASLSGGPCLRVVDGDSVSVAACAPDLCFSGFAFPWIGRRDDGMQPGSCVCNPVLAIPSPWGLVITGVVTALILGAAVKR